MLEGCAGNINLLTTSVINLFLSQLHALRVSLYNSATTHNGSTLSISLWQSLEA
jgi:hypothetical protein